MKGQWKDAARGGHPEHWQALRGGQGWRSDSCVMRLRALELSGSDLSHMVTFWGSNHLLVQTKIILWQFPEHKLKCLIKSYES